MKILLLDIECSPNLVYTWDLFNAFIPFNYVVKQHKTICWAAKWLGEDKIMFDSVQASNTKAMLKGIYDLINEADAVVHYNGKKFDMKVLNRDFVINGMKPPQPVKQIDLYQVVKKQFAFPSNKLAYVVLALGLGEKGDPSSELWTRCLDGEAKAWREIEEYNKNDVILLEKLYETVKGWIPNPPNYGLYIESESPVCPYCGHDGLVKRGFRVTKTRKYQRCQCKKCGGWSSARLSEKGEGNSVLSPT